MLCDWQLVQSEYCFVHSLLRGVVQVWPSIRLTASYKHALMLLPCSYCRCTFLLMRFYSSAKEFGQPIYMTALTETSGALWELVTTRFITRLTGTIMGTTRCFSIGYSARCVTLLNGRQHMRRLRSELAGSTLPCLSLLFISVDGCDGFQMVVQRYAESNIGDNTCLGAIKRTSLSRHGSPYTTVGLILGEFQGLPSTKTIWVSFFAQTCICIVQ